MGGLHAKPLWIRDPGGQHSHAQDAALSVSLSCLKFCNIDGKIMSHTEPDKARRYLDLLDTARCNGRWAEVPELARKVEKHVPRRKCLALTARTEYQIASNLSQRSAQLSISEKNNSLPRQIEPLSAAAEAEKSFPEDAFEAHVCLGWLYWSLGEAGQALSHIPPDAAQRSELLNQNGRTLSGWTHVCIVKGAYIRGVSQEHAGSSREAIETYQSLIPSISDTPKIVGSSPEYRLWTEKLLSRYCHIIARHVKSKSNDFDELLSTTSLVPTSSILPPFRIWAKLLASETDYGTRSIQSNEKPSPRRQIWQDYYITLSVLLQHQASFGFKHGRGPRTSQNNHFGIRFHFDSKIAQYAELKRVESAYESLLLNQVGFPQANEANVEVENWTDQVMFNWSLLVGPDWEEDDLEKGGKAGVGQKVLAILYRAATRTFHSTRILRHLFTVHAGLAEFELASKALDSYIEIVARGKARVDKSGEPEIGLDDDSTVLTTAAAGINMLCMNGGRTEAERSQDIIKIIEKWLENDHVHQPARNAEDVPHDCEDHPSEIIPRAAGTSLAAAHRALGVSRTRWSRLTYKPSERAELQEQAVSSFRMALEASVGEESNMKTLYALSLALAEKRDIEASVESIKRAISAATTTLDESSDDDSSDVQENPLQDHPLAKRRLLFRSWHLLSLLLTAKQNFDAAANSCEAAFDLYGGSSALFGDQGPSDLLKSLGLFTKRDIVELKITHLALVEVIDGPEEAVNASGELLGLYAKLFQYTEPSVAKISPVSTVSPPESANSAPRSLRASIFGHAHKFGSNNRKSQLVMGATGSRSTDSQVSPLGSGVAPSIQVTSEGAGEEPRHHHHVFHHGSGKLHKRDSRKGMGSVRNGRTSSPTRLPTAKNTNQANFNLPSPSRPSTANSSNPRSTNSDPYASDEVGVAVSHNGPSANNGPPAGLDGASSTVASLPPTSQNTNQNPSPHFPKPPTHQAPSSSSSFIGQPFPVPDPIFNPTDTQRHSLTLLVTIWCLMASLYRRASMPTDAAASIAEADTHVRTIETLVVKQNGSSNRTLVSPGWGGAKAVAELWADVLAEKAMLYSSKHEKQEAEDAYEKALDWWPDHIAATVGLCGLLLDSYEASNPPVARKASPSDPLHININFTPTSTHPTDSPPSDTPRKMDSTERLSHLAARDRAYGLLSMLTKSGQGWDSSEAWMALARAHELCGEVEKAKEALWWVVELEEGRGVRGWDVVGGW